MYVPPHSAPHCAGLFEKLRRPRSLVHLRTIVGVATEGGKPQKGTKGTKRLAKSLVSKNVFCAFCASLWLMRFCVLCLFVATLAAFQSEDPNRLRPLHEDS